MAKPKLGSGGRFKALESKLGKEKHEDHPGAIAAAIGMKKYGKKRFEAMAAAGRRRHNK